MLPTRVSFLVLRLVTSSSSFSAASIRSLISLDLAFCSCRVTRSAYLTLVLALRLFDARADLLRECVVLLLEVVDLVSHWKRVSEV